MEDIRIGRRAASAADLVTIGTVSVEVAPASPDRIYLVLGPPDSGVLTYSVKSPVVTAQGLNVASGQAPIELDIRVHGQLVTKAWFGIHSAAVKTIFIGQTILPEK
jgi:hypothetical protein